MQASKCSEGVYNHETEDFMPARGNREKNNGIEGTAKQIALENQKTKKERLCRYPEKS